MDNIAWDQLEHNYGNASDIPALLERARHPDSTAAEAAAMELQNLLYHQGGWVCSAATVAVPFLMNLAADPAVHCRELLLETVASIASTPRKVDQRQVDPGWPSAWQAAWPAVVALMSDKDPFVRGWAYYRLFTIDGVVGVGSRLSRVVIWRCSSSGCGSRGRSRGGVRGGR